MEVPLKLIFGVLILTIYFVWTDADNKTEGKKPPRVRKIYRERIKYLEQHVSDLRKERHRSTRFHFVTLLTKVTTAWDALPERKDVTLSQMNGSELCPVYFHVDLVEMGRPNDLGVIDVCIVKENGSFVGSSIFSPGGKIEFLGDSYTPSEFLDERNLVTGYVNGQTSSLASGYIDDGVQKIHRRIFSLGIYPKLKIDRFFYGIVRIFDKLRRYHAHYYIEPISNAVLYSERFLCEDIPCTDGQNAILFEFIPHEDYMDEKTRAACASKLNRPAIKDPPKSDWNEEVQGAHFMEENIFHDDDDIVHTRTVSGSSNTKMFDLRFFDDMICEMCVWIQPNFAEKFGLGLDIERGVAETINILKFTNQIFRSLDFNDDGVTENIGISIKQLIVSDEISALNPNGEVVPNNISRVISTTTPKIALKNMETSMKGKFQDCCITVGFIYHNMAPAIMGTTVAGICTPNYNYGIVSGYTHSHKLGYFDVYRGLMHTLGHLLGGTHDVISEAHCYKDVEPRTEFRNEYPLHPIQIINLGMRPKSLTFSPCSKDEITKFLTSKIPHCLKDTDEESFCGNGVVEPGEDCDCGSIRDCHLRHACCGESDSVMGCKIITPGKKRCFRRSTA